MLTVQFWGYGKRENATSTPSGDPIATYPLVELKDNCSLVNPSLKIKEPVTRNVHTWNYCYIREFNRYYYVTDWIWDFGIWVCELQVDVLASFKFEIGLQTCYVLRAYQDSAGNYISDGNVVDNTYPCTAGAPTYSNSAIRNPFGLQTTTLSGMFIVGIINQGSTGLTYYAFDNTGYGEFCSKLFNYSTGWLDIDPDEISEDLQKALINPFQYVVSSIYLPISFSWLSDYGAGTPTSSIKFGWWSISVTGGHARIIPKNVLYESENTLTIPKHPSASSRGAYLNLNPYSIYTLKYYPFGVFDIDSEAISNYSSLNLRVAVDICTGKAILTIYVATVNSPVRVVEGNISVPIPTISVNVDYVNLGSMSTALSAGASVVSQLGAGTSGSWLQNARSNAKSFVANLRAGNWSEIGSGLKETISNIASSVFASKATAEITGQQGSFTLFDNQYVALSGRFLPVVAEDYSHRGRPLCQIRQINTLRGFILCSDADVVIACTDREKSAIQAYMESGFYYTD